ncbi:MAG TPA: ATP-dependent protease ATPase subunit HslU [Thermoanaerobaculia bacterium]|nr:ATP-dependent protease ATPase subunit HslU [Thermoanaerobaculia bacterium]
MLVVSDPSLPSLVEDLTPRQIVAELDRHVVGQRAAKRAVAIALRNRWRRQQLPAEIAEEVVPKNILMIGATGVGKTEIARRLAKLARAPFMKVEASKFTEVGYVGRDVESIVRDLTEIGVAMVREERREAVLEEARQRSEDRLLQLLVPPPPQRAPAAEDQAPPADDLRETREKFRDRLRRGALDDKLVEIEVEESALPQLEMITPQGIEEVGINLRDMMPGLFSRRQRRQVRVVEAREILLQQEAEKMIDRQQVAAEARRRVEQAGIVFLDEIDKICGREGSHGPDISREGVQRDLLPIVEGTTVTTKHGAVRTDHVLFIGAGAFHVSKPSDMIPELQGRFPIRVELEALSEEDFVRILTEPDNSLTRQYRELLGTEGVILEFTDDAVARLARLAVEVNSIMENIGARRLATLMERVLEEVSFEAPDMAGVELRVDAAYVDRALAGIIEDRDLSRYIL